jgi:hypothetical protein
MQPRYLQKSGMAKDRSVKAWVAPEHFEIDVDMSDGKEHQVALYCMAWNPKVDLTVEVQDADTKAVLDTQTMKNFVDGKYLVWNVKGEVIIRVRANVQDEGTQAQASGVFIDPVKKSGN